MPSGGSPNSGARLYAGKLTVGVVDIFNVQSPPNGAVEARQGALAILTIDGAPIVYINTTPVADGETQSDNWEVLTQTMSPSVEGSVTFRPGGPAAPGVYTSWATLTTFLTSLATIGAGIRAVRIYCDDTFQSPIVLPPGAYTTPVQVAFQALGNLSSAPTIRLADGFRFGRTGGGFPLYEINGLEIETLADTTGSGLVPFEVLPGEAATLDVLNFAILRATVDVEMILISGGSLQINLDTGILDNGGYEVINVDPLSTATIEGAERAAVDADTVRGAGNLNLDVNVSSANLSAVQVNFVGVLTKSYRTKAENEGYTAGAPADWVGPPPPTAQDALDRLASAVAGLLAAPIP